MLIAGNCLSLLPSLFFNIYLSPINGLSVVRDSVVVVRASTGIENQPYRKQKTVLYRTLYRFN